MRRLLGVLLLAVSATGCASSGTDAGSGATTPEAELVTIEGTWHYRDPYFIDYSETDLQIGCQEDIGPHDLLVFSGDSDTSLITLPISYEAGDDECVAPFDVTIPAADLFRLELTNPETASRFFTVYVDRSEIDGEISVTTTLEGDGTYDTSVDY